jgi:hypothetical protein
MVGRECRGSTASRKAIARDGATMATRGRKRRSSKKGSKRGSATLAGTKRTTPKVEIPKFGLVKYKKASWRSGSDD